MPLVQNLRSREAETLWKGQEVEEIILEFIESSNDVFWVTQLGPEQEVYVSPAVERVWGVTAESFEDNPRRWADKILPEDRQEVLEAFEAWLSGGIDAKFDTVFRIFGPDGAIRWVHDRGIWISGEPGGVRIVAGIASDITELKETEQALQAREAELRNALNERERVNQDLHDNTLQTLYAIGLELDAARLTLDSGHTALSDKLRAASLRLNEAIQDIRDFIRAGASLSRQARGLPRAMKDLASTFNTTDGPRIVFSVDDAACNQIPSHKHLDILSIIRECLSNATRHGSARNIRVQAFMNDGIDFSVSDDGIGFDVEAVDTPGHGLNNIRARADRLGAALNVVSGRGNGTTVTVRFPT